jgi:glycosyltransferase involved in cell wall biosynthesis
MPPRLSVVVIFHNMRREAARTLFSLSPPYQRCIQPDEYEVIAIDNGSSAPLEAGEVERWSANFRYLYHPTSAVSPAAAVNLGVELARGEHVAVCIDGARMLSPGLLRYALLALQTFRTPFICTRAWHLGHELQNVSMTRGYDQASEDALLQSVNWRDDGYELFTISSIAWSSGDGWFGPLAESNCFVIDKGTFQSLGGMDTRFVSPGGGLVNHDFFARACADPGLTPVILLGEGTFHQFHGGIATNAPLGSHRFEDFREEYHQLRGMEYQVPIFQPLYFGHMPPAACRFLVPNQGVPA